MSRAEKVKAEKRVVRAAMRVYRLNGPMDERWVTQLCAADREFYRACAALRPRRQARRRK